MYYACYRLSRMGWNVMPTARNARGIDIIAYNRGNSVVPQDTHLVRGGALFSDVGLGVG